MSTSKLNGLILNSKTAFTLSVPCVPKGSLSRESIKIKLARLSIYIPAFFRALFFLWTIFEGGHFGRNFKILSKNYRAFFILNDKNMVPYANESHFIIKTGENWYLVLFIWIRIFFGQNVEILDIVGGQENREKMAPSNQIIRGMQQIPKFY